MEIFFLVGIITMFLMLFVSGGGFIAAIIFGIVYFGLFVYVIPGIIDKRMKKKLDEEMEKLKPVKEYNAFVKECREPLLKLLDHHFLENESDREYVLNVAKQLEENRDKVKELKSKVTYWGDQDPNSVDQRYRLYKLDSVRAISLFEYDSRKSYRCIHDFEALNDKYIEYYDPDYKFTSNKIAALILYENGELDKDFFASTRDLVNHLDERN